MQIQPNRVLGKLVSFLFTRGGVFLWNICFVDKALFFR